MLECVVNVSEGARADVVAAIAGSAGADLLDLHADPHHNRSVLTVVGEDAPRAITRAAVERLDLGTHHGVHPRIGVVDVVPFVALGPEPHQAAVVAREAFAAWAAAELGIPCFRYDDERPLPLVRREAFRSLSPDVGPDLPHPTAGAIAVGARRVLVAYNVWLADADLDRAREVAASVRGPALRALGLPVGGRVQVSMNLLSPDRLGPAAAYDLVAAAVRVTGAELVGLVPRRVLAAVPASRWDELDLAPERTIEARLEARAAEVGG